MRPLRRCHVCFNVYQGVDVERCAGCLHVNRRADPWVERYIRTLHLQGRWRDGDDVCVSEAALDREAESARDLRAVRPSTGAGAASDAGTPVIAACSDHAWYGVAHTVGPRWTQITARIAVCPTCHFARAAAPGPQCQPGDHDDRTPGSTRDQSYQTQVLETVVVSLAFVALGLLIRWATT